MKCPKCNTSNEDSAKYCKECGEKLEQTNNNICPVCSKPINGEKYCPNCGVKIDLHGKDNNETRKQKANRIINLVFNILSIVVLSLCLLFAWLPVVKLSTTIDGQQNFGNVFYTLFDQWKNLNFDGLTSNQIAVRLISTIVPFIIVLSNVVITYIFSIRGIVNSSKNLIDKKEYVSITPILVVLIVNVMSIAFMSSFGANGYVVLSTGDTYQYYVNTGVGSGTIVALVGILTFAIAAYRIYLSFNKNMVSIFVEKILFTISCFFGLTLLGNTSTSFIGLLSSTTPINEGSISYGVMYAFLDNILKLNTGIESYEFYVAFVANSLSLLLDLIIFASVSGFIFFMFQTLFKNDTLSFKLKKTLLIGNIITTSILILNVTLSIICVICYSKFYNIDTTLMFIGDGVYNSLNNSLFMLGIAIAGYIISKKYITAVKNDEIEING